MAGVREASRDLFCDHPTSRPGRDFFFTAPVRDRRPELDSQKADPGDGDLARSIEDAKKDERWEVVTELAKKSGHYPNLKA